LAAGIERAGQFPIIMQTSDVFDYFDSFGSGEKKERYLLLGQVGSDFSGAGFFTRSFLSSLILLKR